MVAAVEANLAGDMDLLRINAIVRSLSSVNLVKNTHPDQDGCQFPIEIIGDVDIRQSQVEAACVIGEIPSTTLCEGIVRDITLSLVNDKGLRKGSPLTKTAVKEMLPAIPPIKVAYLQGLPVFFQERMVDRPMKETPLEETN